MRRLGAALIAVTGILALAAPAHAATFNVNSAADEPDADTGVAACATASGSCTLRAAIDQANAEDSDTVINLPGGTYTLTGGIAENDNQGGDLDIHSRGFTVAINGAGARGTIINAAGIDRVLDIDTSSKVVVRGVTITGGDTNVVDDFTGGELELEEAFNIFIALISGRLSDGGGIYLDGPAEGEDPPSELTLIDSTVTGNRAGNEIQLIELFGEETAEQLFVFLTEELEVPEELAFFLIVNEFVFGDGGGIHAGEGTQLSITGSTISANTALDDGGGIESDSASTSILNSTIHANSAAGGADGDGDGGGIEQGEGTLSVVHATITNNTAPDKGGGVNLEQDDPCSDNFLFCLFFDGFFGGESFEALKRLETGDEKLKPLQDEQPPPDGSFRNTILAANQAAGEGPNCRADEESALTSAGTNLENGTDCGFSAAGNLQSTDPQLGPLANNGGGTNTRALGPTSPALHRAATDPCPPVDQRGTVRPQGPECDIGAFERLLEADLGVVIGDSPDPVAGGGNITYTVLVGNAGPDPATNVRVTLDVPANTTVQSSSVEGGGSCSGTTTLTCDLGDMAVGQTRRIIVVVRTRADEAGTSTATARAAQEGGTLRATASVDGDERDPDSSNNEAETSTSIETGASEDETAGGGGDDGAGVAGVSGVSDTVSGEGGGLPFTGLPLPILLAFGGWMLGAGLTLGLWIRSWS